jgi:hypothetical protein
VLSPEERQHRLNVKGMDKDDQYRTLAHLTQSSIARILGVDRHTVSRNLQRIREDDEKIVATVVSEIENVLPKQVTRDALDRMQEYGTDGFREFYTTFSGYTKFPEHWQPWCEAYFRESSLILNVPPGHFKTAWVRWLIIYTIATDRNVQILNLSETGRFAVQTCQYVAAHFTNNELLIATYGEFKPAVKGMVTWSPNTGKIVVSNKTLADEGEGASYTLQSLGQNQQIYGARADLVFGDDPTNAAITRSQVDSGELLRKFHEEIPTRFKGASERYGHGGKLVVVGQRVGYMDLYQQLAEEVYEIGDQKGEPKFALECYPAVLDWEKKIVLAPDYYDWAYIENMYNRMTHASFQCLYQQVPEPPGGSIVSEEDLAACRDRDRVNWQHGRRTGQEAINRVFSIDPGAATGYYGLTVADVHWRPDVTQCYVEVLYTDRRHFKHLDEFIREAKIITYGHDCDTVIIEDTGFSKHMQDHAFFRDLQKNGVDWKRHTTGINKHHAEWGIQNLGALFEQRRISLPYGDPESAKASGHLEEELRRYDPDTKRKHTQDIVDSLWFIAWSLRKLRPRSTYTGKVAIYSDFDKDGLINGVRGRVAGVAIRDMRESPSVRIAKAKLKKQVGVRLDGIPMDDFEIKALLKRKEEQQEKARRAAVAAAELAEDEELAADAGPLSRAMRGLG